MFHISEGEMKTSTLFLSACGIVTAVLLQTTAACAQASDEAQIRALEDNFAAGIRVKDLDAIMRVYVPDETLFVFDVVPPRQYVGATAYRKDWEEFLNDIDGPVNFEITDLAVVTEGNLGYSHSIQRVSGKNKKGDVLDLTVRVTDAYRKIDGHWLVTMEHVSVPVNLDTGEPDLKSRP
jgi:ketosteroid isomerase-like protein